MKYQEYQYLAFLYHLQQLAINKISEYPDSQEYQFIYDRLTEIISELESLKSALINNPEREISYHDFLDKYFLSDADKIDYELGIIEKNYAPYEDFSFDDDLEMGYPSDYIMEKHHLTPDEFSLKLKSY